MKHANAHADLPLMRSVYIFCVKNDKNFKLSIFLNNKPLRSMGGVEGNLHSLQSSAHGGELRITADFTDMLTARYPFGRKVLLTRYQNRSEQTNSKKQTIMPAASHFID
jgi:hypothetical protein